MSPTIFQREGQVRSNGVRRWIRHESGFTLGIAGVGEVESSRVRGVGGRGTVLSKIAAGRVASEHAKGETMFGADGTSVHTRNADETQQWREMKVSVFAMIAESEEFQERCQRERRRLGFGSVTTTVGDRAKWF